MLQAIYIHVILLLSVMGHITSHGQDSANNSKYLKQHKTEKLCTSDYNAKMTWLVSLKNLCHIYSTKALFINVLANTEIQHLQKKIITEQNFNYIT